MSSYCYVLIKFVIYIVDKLLLTYIFTGALGYTGAYFGAGSGPIHLDHVVCSALSTISLTVN